MEKRLKDHEARNEARKLAPEVRSKKHMAKWQVTSALQYRRSTRLPHGCSLYFLVCMYCGSSVYLDVQLIRPSDGAAGSPERESSLRLGTGELRAFPFSMRATTLRVAHRRLRPDVCGYAR